MALSKTTDTPMAAPTPAPFPAAEASVVMVCFTFDLAETAAFSFNSSILAETLP